MVSKVGPQNNSVFVFQECCHFLAPKIRPEIGLENWSIFGNVGNRGGWFFCTNALGARLRSVGNAVPMETQRPRGRGKRPIDTWSHHSGLLGASARRGRAEPAGRHWKRVYSCARALSCDACVFGATAARSSVTFPRTVSMQWPALVGALPQLRELARRVADLARRKLF